MMNRRPSVLVFPLCVLLSGCGDDWGDKLERFVDEEIHGLTLAIAQSELEVRWFDYFNGLTTKGILVVDAAGRLNNTNQIAEASLVTFEDRERVLGLVDAADENTIQASKMLRSATAELDAAQDICESVNALHSVDVTSIGSRIAAQITLPKADWYVELSCEFGSSIDQSGGGGSRSDKQGGGSGCWKSLVSLVTAIFGADKQKQQRDKADAAIARIPSKLVTSKEVQEISQATCRKAANTPLLRAGLDSVRLALNQSIQNNGAVANALIDMRRHIDAYQVPLMISKVRDQTGIERTALEITTEYELQRVVRAVDEQRKDLAAFEARLNNAKSCSTVAASLELFGLLLSEKRTQLEAAVKSGSTYSGSFASLLSVVEDAQENLVTKHKSRKAELCGSNG